MENNAHVVNLTIPSQTGFEKMAMSVVEYLARDIGLSQKKVARLKTALGEACMNAMEHGNRFNENLDVTIRFMLHRSKLEVTVQDSGVGGYISLPTDDPDLEAKVSGQASTRGWGIFLIKNLVDEFEIAPLPKGGNLLRMASYIEPVSEDVNTG